MFDSVSNTLRVHQVGFDFEMRECPDYRCLTEVPEIESLKLGAHARHEW